MSLPLTCRIAKTVLLTAAGAASVVGTAGVASAAELPTTADVGGLSKLDSGVTGDVEGTASEGAKALTPMSSSSPLHGTSVPDAGMSVDTNNGKVAPDAAKLAGSAAGGTGQGLQQQTPHVQKHMPQVRTQGLPTDNQAQGTPLLGTIGQNGTAKATTGKGTPAQGTPAQGKASGLGNLPGKNVLPNGLGTVALGQ
jgi:hypothetical protein